MPATLTTPQRRWYLTSAPTDDGIAPSMPTRDTDPNPLEAARAGEGETFAYLDDQHHPHRVNLSAEQVSTVLRAFIRETALTAMGLWTLAPDAARAYLTTGDPALRDAALAEARAAGIKTQYKHTSAAGRTTKHFNGKREAAIRAAWICSLVLDIGPDASPANALRLTWDVAFQTAEVLGWADVHGVTERQTDMRVERSAVHYGELGERLAAMLDAAQA